MARSHRAEGFIAIALILRSDASLPDDNHLVSEAVVSTNMHYERYRQHQGRAYDKLTEQSAFRRLDTLA